MSSVVYWLHLPEHTDMFTQGYIGVTKDMKKRFSDHKSTTENVHLKRAIVKYGWDNIVKTTVLIAETAYCLMIEAKLRAEDKIGWNIVKGGGMPPSALGKKFVKSEETRKKLSLANKGRRHAPEIEAKVIENLIHGINTRFVKGLIPWNKGRAMTDEEKAHYKVQATCPHCNKTGKIAGMRRWHFDNCKLKGVN